MSRDIAITESYLTSVFKLNNQEKKATLSTIKKMSEVTKSTALKIHDIDKVKCDKRLRSARVNRDLRIIFLVQGDVYTMLYVDHHDDAYKWCEGKYLEKTNFGAEYIYDEKKFSNREDYSFVEAEQYYSDKKSLLDGNDIKLKNLIKLGISEVHAEILMKMTDENRLLDYVMVFPEEIQEGVLDLASGARTFEEVFNDLIELNESEEIINGIEQKDSKRRFYITKSIDELEYLMENDDFEKWKIFLHPSQNKLAYGNYNGPALVEGGPGTGKTIVGIHRAVYLSEHKFTIENNKKILICTYSKKLANIIKSKVSELMKQKKLESNIDVMSVDSYFYRILELNKRNINVDMKAFLDLFKRLYFAENRDETLEFYHYEYFEIIEKQNIKTLDHYLSVDRSGTGQGIHKSKRIRIWTFFEKLLEAKKEYNIYTFVDRAILVDSLIKEGFIEPMYDSIIIDEAQDLETLKMKAISNSVKSKINGLFILSDVNQRIFRLSTWKKDVGINVVGRTYYLSLNYRTTKQISDYARYQFVNTKISLTHLREYKSITKGNVPIIECFSNETNQMKFIVQKIERYISYGYPLHEIGVICPNHSYCNQIKSVLEFNDISVNYITGDAIPTKGKGVSLVTTSGVKGLEFSVAFIYQYLEIGNNKSTYYAKPELNLDFNKMIECEKYVAATRARDELIITYVEEDEE